MAVVEVLCVAVVVVVVVEYSEYVVAEEVCEEWGLALQ